MKRALRSAVMAALLLAAGNSWALGLGQIQIKSKRNQPLLAEIPIVSTTPGELAKLQARLASPETFRRIGLEPPSGIAADLQFSLGSDAQGRPVIRVTTLKPVEQSALNFLIEVDWGKGRLVREYSVLVDAPNTAGSAVQPTVQMAHTPDASVVQRPLAEQAPVAVAQLPAAPAAAPVPEPAPVPAPEPAPEPASAADAAAVPVANPAPVEPTPASTAVVEQPMAPEPAPPASSAATENSAKTWSVQYGQTLSKIANQLSLREDFSLNQTMLALLRANPDAFLDDNINRLRAGAVLRLPAHAEVASIGADEAKQVVREQMRQWRQARRAVSQPVAANEAGAAGGAKVGATEVANTAAASAQKSGARLQIVPPAGAVKGNGIKSGTNAGGEGSMLQQELQQRDEDIAAKTAEIGELKERIAALEKLKGEQQKLISLKDSEMASVQAKLATAQKTSEQAAAGANAAVPGAGPSPWLWGGVGVLVLALLAWLLGRRRKPAAQQRRSVFDSEALAASMSAPMRTDVPSVEVEAASAVSQVAGAEVGVDAAASVDSETAVQNEARVEVDLTSELPAAAQSDAPNWHSGWVKREPSAAGEPVESEPAVTTTTAVDPAPAPASAGLSAQASAEQRFKMANAFLESGDEASAQQLLLDLLDDEDSTVSDEAARILSKLVG